MSIDTKDNGANVSFKPITKDSHFYKRRHTSYKDFNSPELGENVRYIINADNNRRHISSLISLGRLFHIVDFSDIEQQLNYESARRGDETFIKSGLRTQAMSVMTQIIAENLADCLFVDENYIYIFDDNLYTRISGGLEDVVKFMLNALTDRDAPAIEKGDKKYDKIYIEYNEIGKIAKSLEHRLLKNITDQSYNMSRSEMEERFVIQFNDCYILRSRVYKGSYTSHPPRFFIERDIWDYVEEYLESGKLPDMSKSKFYDLTNHLSNRDGATHRRLLSNCSLIFNNSLSIQARSSTGTKFYGTTGENGKSTIVNYLISLVRSEYHSAFSASSFKDGTSVLEIANCLMASDADEQSHIGDEAAQNLKKIITADPVSFRKAYGKEKSTVYSIASFFTCSNVIITSSDKSDGFARRFDWFEIEERLRRSQSWFDELNTHEERVLDTAYLVCLLDKETKSNERAPISKQMKLTAMKFTEANDSAKDFVDEVGVDAIIGFSVTEIKKKYQDWCLLNSRVELKSKFNRTIEAQFKLVRTKVTKDYLSMESEYYVPMSVGQIKQIVAWQTQKPTKFGISEAYSKAGNEAVNTADGKVDHSKDASSNDTNKALQEILNNADSLTPEMIAALKSALIDKDKNLDNSTKDEDSDKTDESHDEDESHKEHEESSQASETTSSEETITTPTDEKSDGSKKLMSDDKSEDILLE